MPAAKKRKVTAIASHSAKAITTFTNVSKSLAISKSVLEKATALNPTVTSYLVHNTKKKRKLCLEEGVGNETIGSAQTVPPAAINQAPRNTKDLTQQLVNAQRLLLTLRKSSQISADTTSTTPTKGAQVLLDKHWLSPSSLIESPPKVSSATDESIVKTHIVGSQKEELPTELFNLIHLHSSFLTALSLHYAHNGTHAPADLRVLCPDVARAWGKRKVLPEDIRRTLGILNRTRIGRDDSGVQPSAELRLFDYGNGKICVEIEVDGGRPEGVTKPLNEDLLNDAFIRNLRELWEQRENVEISLANFIRNLPLENVTTCSSLLKTSPSLAKGQQRLTDLKASVVLKRDAEMERKRAITTSATTGETGRKLTLLERLKAKELQQSASPAPLSKGVLAQKAALHKLKEIFGVLLILSTSTSVGQQRISFTMQTVLERLRDSLKTPISKEEGEICLRLLASSIAPEWLTVVKIGKSDAIIVNRDNRPSDSDIEERVKSAI